MSLIQFYDRTPNKSQAVSGAADVFISNFPLITVKLRTPTEDEVVFTHVLVND